MFELFFGNYLISNKLITEKQLMEVIETQKTSRVKLGLIAVAEKMLTARQTYEINMLQVTLDKRFGDIAVEKGYLTDEQVGKLLSLQGNPYLLFVQTITEKNIMSMADVELAITHYKKDNNFSDEDLEAIKSGDVDRITQVFINIDKPLYNDLIALVIRNIIRFIDTSVSFKAPYISNDYRFDFLATQCLKGDYNILVGFAGKDKSLLSIANPYAKEDFEEVDEDALDAVCEFINCVNGLFASKLSYDDVDIDMIPPIAYTDCSLLSETGFYVLPLRINNKDISLIISINSSIIIK